MSIQARAQHQHRLANRFSAQADADVAALHVAPATRRAVSAARASRQAAHAPMSPAHHQPPPDRRSAAVQALRSFDRVAVSPASQQQSGPCTSCARAARAPVTTAPRRERARRLKLTSRRITRRHLTPQTHTSRRRSRLQAALSPRSTPPAVQTARCAGAPRARWLAPAPRRAFLRRPAHRSAPPRAHRAARRRRLLRCSTARRWRRRRG